jgi:NitT/TauT family transport system substrate-binding protein
MSFVPSRRAVLTAAVFALICTPVFAESAPAPIVQVRGGFIPVLGGAMFPSQPGTVVAVSGAFLAKYPDRVQKLVDGLVKADAMIKSDPQRVAPYIQAALGAGPIDTDTILKALNSPASKFTVDPRVIIDATAKMQSFQVSIGTLDKDVPLAGLFDTSFYLKAIGSTP